MSAGGVPLNKDQIAALLSTGRGGGPKKDPTEPREAGTWFKLDHMMREEGCENPNCKDTRPEEDVGRKVVTKIKGQHMCHFCFLAGWLSDESIKVGGLE